MRDFDSSLGMIIPYAGNILTENFEHALIGITHVIHLAALTDVDQSHTNQKKFMEVNFRGFTKIADVCLEKKIKLFFPSTTSTYSSTALVVDETCTDLNAYSPYGASKLAAEQYLLKLKKQGLKFVICRLGTIFGYSPKMRFNTAVNKFIWEALHQRPLPIWKTAWKQKRPYLALSDCIDAINFILRHNLFDGEIYNILTGNYTVEEVIHTIREYIPTLTMMVVDSPAMNPLSYEVSDQKIRSQGFRPKGNLRADIYETITKFNTSL